MSLTDKELEDLKEIKKILGEMKPLVDRPHIYEGPVDALKHDDDLGWKEWNLYTEQREREKELKELKFDNNGWAYRVAEEYVPVMKEEVAKELDTTTFRQIAEEYGIVAKAAKRTSKPRRPRTPAYKKDDRVNTPNGPGSVWGVDRDGTICVELDSDPTILHEFEKKEIKKIK